MIGVIVTLIGAMFSAWLGGVVGRNLAGATAGPTPEVDELDRSEVQSALEEARDIVDAIWNDRIDCESKVAALFLASCLFTVAWVTASLGTITTGAGVYFAVFTVANCAFWSAYVQAKRISEDKRIAGIAASTAVARLEARLQEQE